MLKVSLVMGEPNRPLGGLPTNVRTTKLSRVVYLIPSSTTVWLGPRSRLWKVIVAAPARLGVATTPASKTQVASMPPSVHIAIVYPLWRPPTSEPYQCPTAAVGNAPAVSRCATP